MLVGRHYFICS